MQLFMFVQLVTSIISNAAFNISIDVCLLLHALSTVNIVQTENTIVKYPVFTSIELLLKHFCQFLILKFEVKSKMKGP